MNDLNLMDSNENVIKGLEESQWRCQGAQAEVAVVDAGLRSKDYGMRSKSVRARSKTDGAQSKMGDCRKSMNGQVCRFGKGCKYVHDFDNINLRQAERKVLPCTFHNTLTGCKNDKNCEYSHTDNTFPKRISRTPMSQKLD